MTQISAKIVADSLTPYGERLTTLLVTMPRYILAEFNTHRMLSKNSASSRAIPFKKMVDAVEQNPFVPVAWMKDHSGMQGTQYFEDERTIINCQTDWLFGMQNAITWASSLNARGLTKQMCNRPLEAYMWHTVLVSATEWENFFALRCPQYELTYTKDNGNLDTEYFRSRTDYTKFTMNKSFAKTDLKFSQENFNTHILDWQKINKGQADIHMMLTAEAIWDAMNESTPKLLVSGEWHIPFGDLINEDKLTELGYSFTGDVKIKIATARCAQTSYTVIGEDEKELNYEKLIALHDKLLKSGHWSPFEHCAKVMTEWEHESYTSRTPHPKLFSTSYTNHGVCGNFKGFIQYRKLFANENITK